MRKTPLVVLTALALALPSVDAWAAATKSTANTTVKKKVTTATRTFSGSLASVDRWGEMQVTIVVRKTTTTVGTKKTVKRKLISVKVTVSPNHTDRSVFINEQALPTLIQEALQAQGSGINMVSGATDSSYGFQSSLQAAIIKAKAW